MSAQLIRAVPRLQRLLDHTLAQTREDMEPGSYPLFVENKRCGDVWPPVLDCLRDVPGVTVCDLRERVDIVRADGDDDLNQTLARLAEILKDAGRAPLWRDELLDVTTEAGEVVGAIERGVVRPLGIRTIAVHLNAWTDQGQLWVARRSLTKNTDPGKWDTLVGGLVAAGEPPSIALMRETLEEAGLRPKDLASCSPLQERLIKRRRLPEGYQREVVQSAEAILKTGVRPINQDGESMTIECFSPSVIAEMLEEGVFTMAATFLILQTLLSRITGQTPSEG